VPGQEFNILVSAGEVSGDRMAASVVSEIARRVPEATFFGAGGDAMEAAGVQLRHHASALAVTGLTEALSRAGAASRMLLDLWRQARSRGVALALLVDYPGINLRLAGLMRRAGVPVLYLGAPQRWAWLGFRAAALARKVDRLAVTLPFEERWFCQRGVPARFVGHPVLDQFVPAEREDARRRLGLSSGPVVALLPGSRANEVRRHLPPLLGALDLLPPEVQPVLAEAPGEAGRMCADQAPGIPRASATLALGAADVALCASGTATLEAAVAGVPSVVFYKVSLLTHGVARRLVRVPWLSLPNLILRQPLLPELIQDRATPEGLAREARRLLQPAEADRIRAGLEEVVSRLGPPGAAARVADMAMELMGLDWETCPGGRAGSPRPEGRRR